MDEPRTLDAQLFGLRLMVLGLLGGLLVIAAVVVFSTLKMFGPMVPGPVPVYAFLGFAALGLVANLVAVPLVVRRQREKVRELVEAGALTEASELALFQRFSAETFLRAALLEGPAILLVMGFMVTGNWLVLATVAVFAALLAAQVPSRNGFIAWLAEVRGCQGM